MFATCVFQSLRSRTLIIRKLQTTIQVVRKKNDTNMLFIPLQALMAEEISDAARKPVNAIFSKARRISDVLSTHYMAREGLCLLYVSETTSASVNSTWALYTTWLVTALNNTRDEIAFNKMVKTNKQTNEQKVRMERLPQSIIWSSMQHDEWSESSSMIYFNCSM